MVEVHTVNLRERSELAHDIRRRGKHFERVILAVFIP